MLCTEITGVDRMRAFSGELTVRLNDQRIPLEDAMEVPPGLRGYVQLALDLPVMNAYFTLEQGPFDLVPAVKARFKPAQPVTRAGMVRSDQSRTQHAGANGATARPP
jgi:hypothetical protein